MTLSFTVQQVLLRPCLDHIWPIFGLIWTLLFSPSYQKYAKLQFKRFFLNTYLKLSEINKDINFLNVCGSVRTYSDKSCLVILGDNVKKRSVFVITSWSSIFLLLSVCRRPDCGDLVLPDNIETVHDGKQSFSVW